MRRTSASHSVLKEITDVTRLQCEINSAVFVRTKNQAKINNAKFHAPQISLLPAPKRVLSSLFSIKRSILEFTLHTLEGRCNQSLSLFLFISVQCLFRTSTWERLLRALPCKTSRWCPRAAFQLLWWRCTIWVINLHLLIISHLTGMYECVWSFVQIIPHLLIILKMIIVSSWISNGIYSVLNFGFEIFYMS